MLQFSLTGLGAFIPQSSLVKMQQVQTASAAEGVTQEVKTNNVENYGYAASIMIMTKVRRLPEENRVDFLRRTLIAIDPTGALWSKVNAAATGYSKTTDSYTAYLAALSQNLSNELVLRLAQLGSQGSGVAGLGQRDLKPESLELVQAAIPGAPTPGTCTADQKSIWTGSFWRRRTTGEVCQTVSSQSLDIHTTTQGGVEVTPTTMISIGPFNCPLPRTDKLVWIYDDYDLLTPEQAAFIRETLLNPEVIAEAHYGSRTYADQPNNSWSPSNESGPGLTSTYLFADGGTMQSQWPTAAPWGGSWLTQQGWFRAIGIQPGDTYARPFGFDRSKNGPIMQFQHPITGKDWGLYIDFGTVGTDITALSTTIEGAASTPQTTRSMVMRFMIAPVPDKSWWDSIKGAIRKVVIKFYEFVIDVGEELSSLMCAIAANPTAAVTAATTAGGPAAGAAVGAGSLVIGEACSKPAPAPLPEPPPDAVPIKRFPWGPVIAGGLAVTGLVAFLLAPPKKRGP